MASSTVKKILKQATDELRGLSETAYLDAQLLLAHILGCSRETLILQHDQNIPAEVTQKFLELIKRRCNLEPIAYILGEKEFWGLSFKVSQDVLIPRPDTEILVQQALNYLNQKSGELSILDLGTGSGAIAVSLAHELKARDRKFSMIALDLSPAALEIAETNARQHACENLIQFMESDWFSNLPVATYGNSFDLIVSNPPYLEIEDPQICEGTRRFEPGTALYAGGNHGLEDISKILDSAQGYLKPGAALLIEIGAAQSIYVTELLTPITPSQHYRNLQIIKDLAGHDRVVKLIKSEEASIRLLT